MRLFLLSLCVALAASQECGPNDSGTGSLSTAAFWKGIDGADKIEELTDKTYATYIKQNPKTFVMLYSPRCRYCVESREGFAGAAKELEGQVNFASVDCTKQKKACNVKDHPVKGYPSFYYYEDGLWTDQYQGQRDTQSFVDYLSAK